MNDKHRIIANITKPHLDQKEWQVDLLGRGVSVHQSFKTMKSTMRWLQTWSTQRGVKIEIRHTIKI